MSFVRSFLYFAILSATLWSVPEVRAAGPALVEDLGRGVVAVRPNATEVFVSWRLLGTDPLDVSFNLYRSTGGGAATLLNGVPLGGATHFTDSTANLAQTNAYFVRPIFFGIEQPASASFTLAANAPQQQFLRVLLQRPADGTSPAGPHSYSPNDTSVGDVDGDGEYELIIKWEPSNARDAAADGFTGNTFIDAYRLDGTRLWRIDLGINVRAGPHDTPFFVFDLDGDGRAEVFMRTAEGTIAGDGQFVAAPAKFHGPVPAVIDHGADRRGFPSNGRALVGPEFLTIFDGLTGVEIASTRYLPARHPDTDFPTSQQLFDIWGDTSGNRQGRHYSPGVAYLDGQRPSIVMGRGYAGGQNNHPGRVALAAWNFRDGVITPLWQFATVGGSGGHTAVVADLTGDGLDDIVYGQVWVRHDGTLIERTDWGHGDALHVSQMDPDKPGQMVYMPHESPGSYGPNGLSVDYGPTGTLVVGVQGSGDLGRGVAADIDPRFRGYEFWGPGATPGLYNVQSITPNAVLGPRGVQVAPTKPSSINHAVWWDGDLLRELLDGTSVRKWDWNAGAEVTVLAPAGIASINGSKSNPNLQVDILGDWREEVIWRESNNDAIRIYVTTAPTTHRIYTLMHDRQYREAIVSQNVGYNQPPHPSFYLGDGMAPPPIPNIVTSLDVLLGPAAPVFTGVTTDAGTLANDQITSDQTLILHGTAEPDTTVTVTRLGVGVIGTAPAGGTGNWSFDYTGTTLPEGFVLFTATATDSEGITGAPTNPPFVVEIDITPPAAPLIADVSDEGGSLVFVGTAEAGSVVTVVADGTTSLGTATADAAGNWTVTYTGPALSTGPHSFTARADDIAGNTGPASGGTNVNTAVTTPVIAAIADDTGSSASDGVTSDATLVFTGTAGAGDTVTLRQIGGAVLGSTPADGGGAWAFDHTGTTLADGLYAFSAAGSNVNGTSPSSPAFLVTVDTVTPLVQSSVRQNPTAPVSTAESITFRVTFSEAVEGVSAGSFTPVFGGGLAGLIVGVVAADDGIFDVTLDLTGEGTVRLDVIAAGSGIADTAGNVLATDFTTGQIYTRALVGDGVWIRAQSGGLWSANANWENGVVADNAGSTANFATLEIDENNLVLLDGPRTLGNLIFGDTEIATPASWVIDNGGVASRTLTLAGAGSPQIITNPLGVGATTTLSMSLAGTQGFTKAGTGVLVLDEANTITGALAVNTGTLRLAPGGVLNTGSGAINATVTNGTTINVAGGSLTAGGLTTLGSGSSVSGLLIVDGGTVALNGGARTNSEGGSTYRVNGGTFTTPDVNIGRNSAGTVSFTSGFIVAGGEANVGTIRLGTVNSNGAMSIEGGTLTATDMITIGNQNTGGRGGGMRVINNGTFISTHNPAGNASGGVVLSRTAGNGNANQVASATFTGGLSLVEKFTLGFDSTVNAGSATITVNGGALYLGSGGIIKNGAPALTTNLNFSSGIVGAKADWSTALNINLPTNGNIAFKAADAANTPHDITMTGVLSGAGGFTKTGAGRLTLGGANTFGGAVTLNAGVLEIDGGIAASANALTVNATGLLTGDGAVNRAVVLNSGGTIMPGNATAGSVLTAASVTWHADGALAYDLDATSNRLAVTGAFAQGGDTPHRFVFNAGPGIAADNLYTLVTFGTTDFTAADFSFDTLAPGLTGAFFVNANEVQFKIYGPPIILASPQDAAVRFGGTANFSVSVGESPTLEYQWYFNGAPIAGATEATLTLTNVQGYHLGSYHVVVTNAAGSTPSDAATLAINALALVHRGPSLNSADVEGSIQQMQAFNATLNGDALVSGNLFVPGLPTVKLNGSPTYGGTLEGTGSATPTGHTITLNSGTTLSHVVRRTDAVALPIAATPLAPTGTRSVTLNHASQSPGDWATLRNLTLNNNVGAIAVPAGAYGNFAINGGNAFVLGVPGATTPAVYHFQQLTLNNNAQVQVVGPVLIVVANGFNVNGGTMGAAAHPEWLTLHAHGNLALNSGGTIHGYVAAPASQITINGNCDIVGGLASDRLTLNSHALLELLGPAFE